MTMQPVRGVHGQVVHELGTRILSGTWQPGTTLDLPAIESELGVSRTVMRESLKVLTAKGLVDARQKRGTFVTEPDTWNMLDDDVLRWRAGGAAGVDLFHELGELRTIVEPAAAALAARRADAADLAALESSLHAMEQAHDERSATRAVDADLAFHAALLRATHNNLLGTLRGVIEHGLRQRDVLVHADAHADDPVPSHRAVFEAVRNQDADAAAEAMHALLDQASRDFESRGRRTSRTRKPRGRRT